MNLRRSILKAIQPEPKTVPINTYNAPMHDAEEREAQCCGTMYHGVEHGDQCQTCGATFTDKQLDTEN